MNENEMISLAGKKPDKLYKFKVRNDMYESTKQFVTGREVLEMAGLVPPERFKLDIRIQGNHVHEVGLDETVDLGQPGIEKFSYITRDQSEG